MESSKIFFLQKTHKGHILQQKKIPLTPKKPKSFIFFQSQKKKIVALYLIWVFVFAVIELLLTILMTEMKNNIISEMISTGIVLFISLTFILTSLNRWKKISYCLTWAIFLGFFFQIIIAQISLNKVEETSTFIYNLFRHKIYLYTTISHSSMCLLMRYSIQWRCVNHIIMSLFDIAAIIGLCLIANKFMFETVYILFIHTFIIFIELIAINYNMSNKGRLDFTNGVESVLSQELELGYAQCLGNNFEIVQKNEIMSKKYSKLMQIKQHYNKKANMKDKELSSNVNCQDSTIINNSTIPIIKNKKRMIAHTNNSTDILKNEIKQYFNAKDFYQKIEYDCLNDQKSKRKQLKISLEDCIMKKIEVCKLENKFGVFQCLGKFKYKKDSFYLHAIIYLRITKNQAKTKYFYEFIIIEIDAPKEKTKTKANYENLLKKISHELRYPNMNIQKIVENIMKENITSKLSSLSSMRDYQANILMTTSTVEQLKLIKYLSEISLLTVRDIIEHSALQKKIIEQEDNNEEECKETRNKASNLDMGSFIKYINEISRSYLYLYNKNQEFKLNIQDIVYNTQIIIDEQKLTQIISNLLTNAIKNTSEHTPIVLSINKLKESDLNSLRSQICKLPVSSNDEQANVLSMGENKLKDENNNTIMGITIELEDYGKGIDADIMNNINNEKTNMKLKWSNDYSVAKGYGAGLQICKKLCEEMNIRLKCELITKKSVLTSATSTKNIVNQFSNPMDNNQQVIGTKFILFIESEVVSKKSSQKRSLADTCIEMKSILIDPNDKQILYNDDNNEEYDSPRFNQNPQVLYHQTSINNKSMIQKKTSKLFISEETAININRKSRSSIHTIQSRKTVWKDKDNNKDTKIEVNKHKNSLLLKTAQSNQKSIINSNNKKTNLSQAANDLLNDISNSDINSIGVLIVDDDANVTDTVRNLISVHCKKMNIKHEITILNDGIELIYALYTELKMNNVTTKLILCDEMMKFINGSDAFMLLQKYFGNIIKDIMFISMSAFSDIVHKHKLNDLGVDLIYEKPITKGQIDFIFDKLLKGKRSS